MSIKESINVTLKNAPNFNSFTPLFNINSSISPMLKPTKNSVQIDTSELSSIRHAPIFRVALTGGPCSGKTSSMVVLQDRFRNMGWNVYVVPEAPTLVFGGGVSYPELPDQGSILFFSLVFILL